MHHRQLVKIYIYIFYTPDIETLFLFI